MPITEYTEPNVCVDENIVLDDAGRPHLRTWAVPRLVSDVLAKSGADGRIVRPLTVLPGKLMIDGKAFYRNTAPIEQQMMIRVTRGPRHWLTSNPNAVQFRDRWTYAVDADPAEPLTSSIYNGHTGSAVDTGTNSVAEPYPGAQWMWSPVNSVDEWLPFLLGPNELLTVWYRCYVWTPPPWSDNAHANNPVHEAYARYARLQLIRFPVQGSVVTG